MNRIQLACYGLIASAFVLTAILLVQLDARFTSEADAALVIARENFTLLTARTRQNEEALFVLDNANERLLIYRLDLGKQALLPAGAFSLPTLFQNAASGGTGNRGARQRR